MKNGSCHTSLSVHSAVLSLVYSVRVAGDAEDVPWSCHTGGHGVTRRVKIRVCLPLTYLNLFIVIVIFLLFLFSLIHLSELGVRFKLLFLF